MDYEGAEYRKLVVKRYPARALRETPEGRYWRQFASPVTAKQFGPVSHVDFCDVYPHHLAITASTRVVVYDGHTRAHRRNFTRFQDTAYSGVWRQDGKLLAAGGEAGIVQVFDGASRGLLRQFKAHKRPVRAVRWAPDKLHLLSGSDDVTARFWDLQEGKQLCRLDGHSDYVRTAAPCAASPDTWATGGYDHIAKLWDVRAAKGGATLSMDHGAPIEDILFFPSGSMVATAGGTSICIWDVLSGGRLLARLSNHQKTVTSIALSPRAGPAFAAAPRLLSGALDGHVKVYELDTFRVTAAVKYGAPVLSVGLSADCSMMAVGCSDGNVFIRRHGKARQAASRAKKEALRLKHRPKLTAANFRYFIRGVNEKAAAADYQVAAQRRANLKPYDRALRKFRYREALDAALATRAPAIVDSVLSELAARGGLSAAIGGRDAEGLLPLLAHVAKYVGEPRHGRTLAGIAHRLLDAYGGVVGLSPTVDAALRRLAAALDAELKLGAELRALQGALEPALCASMAG